MVETELERLVAQQTQDDNTTIRPEFPGWQVPFTNGLANCIGMVSDGEIVTFVPRPPKGVLLVARHMGSVACSTYGGYTAAWVSLCAV